MWWMWTLGGIVALLGIGFLFGINGLGATRSLSLRDLDLSAVPDGSYAGEYTKGRFKALVKVTVKNHEITDVTPVGIDRSKPANRGIVDVYDMAASKIVAAQTPRIDAVSGATATTNAFLGAVQDALRKAGGH